MHIVCIASDFSFGRYIKYGLKFQNLTVTVHYGLGALDKVHVLAADALFLSASLFDTTPQLNHFNVPTFLLVDVPLTWRIPEEYFDAYFQRPFSFSYVAAVVKNSVMLHKNRGAAQSLQVKDLFLNLETREVERAGVKIALSNKEFALLEFLMKNPGRVLTRDVILENVWDQNTNILTNTVDVHIKNLRKKLESPSTTRLITTVYCVGYRFG